MKVPLVKLRKQELARNSANSNFRTSTVSIEGFTMIRPAPTSEIARRSVSRGGRGLFLFFGPRVAWMNLAMKLLLCCLIPFEDFQNIRKLTITHAHAYQPGDSHEHACLAAFWTADESGNQCPRETERERHSHEVLAGFEVPANHCPLSRSETLHPACRVPSGAMNYVDPAAVDIDPLRRPPRSA